MVVSIERWIGKVAIVTGASSGIGAAIVDALVENGLIVVGVARRVELVEEKAKKLANKKGKLHALKADVSNEEDILGVFQWIKKNLGNVSILINNAGVAITSTLSDGKAEDWKKIFDLNVIGLSIMTREAVKNMTENNVNGHIIHINSILGHRPCSYPTVNVYPASKYAVTALTDTLRQEFNVKKLKIKITSLSPGLVESELTTLKKDMPPEQKAFVCQLPILKAEDIADGIIYALSTPEHVQINELTITPVGEVI